MSTGTNNQIVGDNSPRPDVKRSDGYISEYLSDYLKNLQLQTKPEYPSDWLRNYELESKPEYPSDWFKNHTESKPCITISDNKIELDELRNIIKASILANVLHVDDAILYLYKILKPMQLKVEHAWSSYGVEITHAGDTANPFSPLTVTQAKRNLNPSSQIGTSAIPDDDKWMPLFITCIYRLSKSRPTDYKILERAANLIRCFGCKDHVPIATISTNYRSWIYDNNFLKVVASIDMFFAKFPRADMAYIRFGTISSRYRDCAALLALNDAVDMVGSTRDAFIDWIFTRSLAYDVWRMMASREEIEKADSYFPYQVDMGLTVKSAYSSGLNESLYFFCNAIAAYLGMGITERAQTKMMLKKDLEETTLNTRLVVYAFTEILDLRPIFDIVPGSNNLFAKVSDDLNVTEPDYTMDQTMSQPTKREPRAWRAWIKRLDYIEPVQMKEKLSEQKKMFKDARRGSIGEYLRKL